MSEAVSVALVTGGAVRVGRAIVTHLAARGWAVAFTYRGSPPRPSELANELRVAGHACLPCRPTSTAPPTAALVVSATLDHFGRLTPSSTTPRCSREHLLRISTR